MLVEGELNDPSLGPDILRRHGPAAPMVGEQGPAGGGVEVLSAQDVVNIPPDQHLPRNKNIVGLRVLQLRVEEI